MKASSPQCRSSRLTSGFGAAAVDDCVSEMRFCADDVSAARRLVVLCFVTGRFFSARLTPEPRRTVLVFFLFFLPLPWSDKQSDAGCPDDDGN